MRRILTGMVLAAAASVYGVDRPEKDPDEIGDSLLEARTWLQMWSQYSLFLEQELAARDVRIRELETAAAEGPVEVTLPEYLAIQERIRTSIEKMAAVSGDLAGLSADIFALIKQPEPEPEPEPVPEPEPPAGTSEPFSFEAESPNAAQRTGPQNERTESNASSSGGAHIAFWRPDEWLEYLTPHVSAGTWVMTLRVANPSAGSSIRVMVDGVPVGTLAVPSTGGWSTWTNLTMPLQLSSSTHRITLVGVTSGWVGNLDVVSFAKQADSSALLFGHEMLAMPPGGGATTQAQVDERVARMASYGLDVIELFHPEAFPDSASKYYTAAERAGIKACLSFGYVGDDIAGKARSLIEQYRNHPAQLKVNGEPYVTAYHGSDQMRAITADCVYVPHMFARGAAGGVLEKPTLDRLRALMDDRPWLDGIASFYPLDDWQEVQSMYLDVMQARGKTYRMSITPRHESVPHKGNWRVFEGAGFEALRDQGLFAVAHRRQIPQLTLVTLNDYSEGTDVIGQRFGETQLVAPQYWNSGDWPAYVARDGSMDFFQRYARWWKTGAEPPITKLELFVCYRLQGKNVAGAPTPNGKPGEWQKFIDAIFVAVRAPAQTVITVNDESQTVGAGEHHLRFAHRPGPVTVKWPGGSRILPSIVDTAAPGAWHSLNMRLVFLRKVSTPVAWKIYFPAESRKSFLSRSSAV